MNRKIISCIILLLACSGMLAQSYIPEKKNKMLVPDVVTVKAFAVPVDKVVLLDGPFKKAMEADAAYLLTIEPDRLLAAWLA
jgi:hypothetical protein